MLLLRVDGTLRSETCARSQTHLPCRAGADEAVLRGRDLLPPRSADPLLWRDALGGGVLRRPLPGALRRVRPRRRGDAAARRLVGPGELSGFWCAWQGPIIPLLEILLSRWCLAALPQILMKVWEVLSASSVKPRTGLDRLVTIGRLKKSGGMPQPCSGFSGPVSRLQMQRFDACAHRWWCLRPRQRAAQAAGARAAASALRLQARLLGLAAAVPVAAAGRAGAAALLPRRRSVHRARRQAALAAAGVAAAAAAGRGSCAHPP